MVITMAKNKQKNNNLLFNMANWLFSAVVAVSSFIFRPLIMVFNLFRRNKSEQLSLEAPLLNTQDPQSVLNDAASVQLPLSRPVSPTSVPLPATIPAPASASRPVTLIAPVTAPQTTTFLPITRSRSLSPAPASPAVTFAQIYQQHFSFVGSLGDGNCFFRAVAYQYYLDRDQEKHIELREKTIDQLVRAMDEYKPYVDDSITVDKHVGEMVKDRTWATEIEIQALSTALNRPIVVFNRSFLHISGPSSVGHNPVTVHGQPLTDVPIFVCFNGSNHYDALALKSGSDPRAVLTEIISLQMQIKPETAQPVLPEACRLR